MTRAWSFLLLLTVTSCGGGGEMAAMDLGPMIVTFGRDLDERKPRTLGQEDGLPPEFHQALAEMAIPLQSLTFPDIGFTYNRDVTRLPWTDRLRHQGQIGPAFARMAAGEVERALALGDSDEAVRELLVSENMYQFRDQFTESRYDRAVAVDVNGQPLLAALKAFYEHAAVEGSPAANRPAWSEIEAGLTTSANAFPAAAQAAIAQCIRGLLIAAELRDQALTVAGQMNMAHWVTFAADYQTSRGTQDGLTAARNASKAIDFDLLSRAGQIAVRSVESLRVALRGAAPAPGARIDLDGPLGRIVLALDAADDTWPGGRDVFLLVDGAGNDTYLDDAATNRDLYHPVSVLLDVAGNDRYQPSDSWDITDGYLPDEWLDPGSRQAAGLFGVAVLDDAAGDDTYKCVRFCQGSGLFGVGVLIDRGGADHYQGYDLSQGSAQFGFGLLVDTGGGKDYYETLQTSQGYGDTRGIGWLVDDAGDDSYLAIETPIILNWANEDTNWSGSQGFGFGNRLLPSGPYLSGGLGALFDQAGNDIYQCAVMCQGFGYFFGTGLLWDKQGDDTHVVTHKYGIGGATHQSVGLFLDGQGADSYTYEGHGRTGGGEGVGLGYDLGVAFHIDSGKDPDSYNFPADIGWIVGFARHPSLGVLINEGGDDQYHITGASGARSLGTSEGFAGDRNAQLGTTTTPSLGMFLDLGGTDVYDVMGSSAANGMTWVQKTPVGDGWDPLLDHGYGRDKD